MPAAVAVKFHKVHTLADIDYSNPWSSLGYYLSGGSCGDGPNWYAYCANNPLAYIDPTGLRVSEEGDYDTAYHPTITPAAPTIVQSPPTYNPPVKTPLSSVERDRVIREIKLAQQLLQRIWNVIDPNGQYPQYQAGYPTYDSRNRIENPLPAQPGAEPGVTWCQAAANEILVQSGIDTSVVLSPSPKTGLPAIGYTNANQMAQNARVAAADPTSGVKEITPEAAQKYANQGIKVLVAAENTQPGQRGHAGVVAPNSQPYDPAQGPMIGQTGTAEVTGINSAQSSFIANGLEPHYYLLPKR